MAITMVTNTVFVNQELPVTLTLQSGSVAVNLSGYTGIVSLRMEDPEGNQGYATADGSTAEMTIDTATSGICSYTISAGTISYPGLWCIKAKVESSGVMSEKICFYAYDEWDI